MAPPPNRVQGQGRAPKILPLPTGSGARTSVVFRPLRFSPTSLSLTAKFGLTLSAAVALSAVSLILLQRFQRKAMAELLAAEVSERSEILNRAVELTSRPLLDFTADYAQWDELVRFVNGPSPERPAINLEPSLANFGLSGVWVMRIDGSVVYALRSGSNKPPPVLPLSAAELQAVISRPPQDTFFARLPDRVVELYLAPVQPSDDTRRLSRPLGWLLVEKTWDQTQLTLLSQMARAKGRLAAVDAPLPAVQPFEAALRYPMFGANGKVAAYFEYVIRSTELEITARHGQTVWWVVGICGLVIATLAIAALYGWVLRPLGAVAESLAHDDLAPLAPLAGKHDELGRVARLVETSFAQRAELQRNLAERNRLGRELHDGAIQTVYAAGMTLGGVRSSLRRAPAEAEQAIDGIRDALNTTIRELRSFLDGLEAEPTAPTHFSDAVRAIVSLLQGVRSIQVALEIEDPTADRLPARIRLHLLQIIREAATNCVRHSQAKTLRIVFRRQLQQMHLEISDDGKGLPEGKVPNPGRGLANLIDRGRELGGKLEFVSAPGQGLRLLLSFPSPASDQA